MSDNCLDKHEVVPKSSAPTPPEWYSERVGIGIDKHRIVPIVNVTWRLKSDGK